MDENHVYLDIKTASFSRKAAILQIRAISFEPYLVEEREQEPYKVLDISVDLVSSLFTAKGEIDTEIIQQNLERDSDFYNFYTKDVIKTIEIQKALEMLNNFLYENVRFGELWIDNYSYTSSVLRHAYEETGIRQECSGSKTARDIGTFLYAVKLSGFTTNVYDLRNISFLENDCIHKKVQQLQGCLTKFKDIVPF